MHNIHIWFLGEHIIVPKESMKNARCQHMDLPLTEINQEQCTNGKAVLQKQKHLQS